MVNHLCILLVKYVYLVMQCTIQHFLNNDIVFNVEILSCKVVSVSCCDVRSDSGSSFIPCVLLAESTMAGKRDVIKP